MWLMLFFAFFCINLREQEIILSKGGLHMDQLIQKELQDIQSHMAASELYVKKCKLYETWAKDDELKRWMNEGAAVHQNQIQVLLNQLRLNNGKQQNH
jgi:hypothetical protein